MNPERWARIKEICGAALEKPRAEQREYVNEVCGADAALCKQVERLLANQDANGFTSPARTWLSAATAPAFAPGTLIGRYRVESKLGAGGMGAVYKAYDAQLRRPVALKVIAPEHPVDREWKRRLIREARAAAALNHPNIVTVHEVGSEGGVDFIVMEYVEGRGLDELIGRKGLKLGEALKYAVQIADALSKAHAAGIVHRDLKPANVIVTAEERVKVLDFGLAKQAEDAFTTDDVTREDRQSTQLGMLVGTAGYMSPEQVERRRVDARSDIFRFGSVLYEMVSGRRAFKRDTPTMTAAAILCMEPESLGAKAPRDLKKVVERCLQKDPGRRLQTMVEVKKALEAVEKGTSRGWAALARIAWPERRRWLTLGLLPVAICIAAAVTGMLGRIHRSIRPYASAPVVISAVEAVPGGGGMPVLVQRFQPKYAKEARAAKTQGVVVLSADILPDGKARDIRVQRGLGMGLDQKAVEAVQQSQFAPPKGGRPVAAMIRVSFRP